MADHIALPWRIAPWSPEESVIAAKGEDGKDNHVAMTAIDADARFIVRAVNSHYALVEALRAVKARGLPDRYSSDRELVDQVDAALALASKEN